MEISYNLKKRTTKTEKYLKMCVINFNTIPYKLTDSGNIFHSILNYKLMRSVSNLLLAKEQKQAKTAKSRKKNQLQMCRIFNGSQ